MCPFAGHNSTMHQLVAATFPTTPAAYKYPGASAQRAMAAISRLVATNAPVGHHGLLKSRASTALRKASIIPSTAAAMAQFFTALRNGPSNVHVDVSALLGGTPRVMVQPNASISQAVVTRLASSV